MINIKYSISDSLLLKRRGLQDGGIYYITFFRVS